MKGWVRFSRLGIGAILLVGLAANGWLVWAESRAWDELNTINEGKRLFAAGRPMLDSFKRSEASGWKVERVDAKTSSAKVVEYQATKDKVTLNVISEVRSGKINRCLMEIGR